MSRKTDENVKNDTRPLSGCCHVGLDDNVRGTGERRKLVGSPNRELASPLEPLRPGVTGDQLFAELGSHNEMREIGCVLTHRSGLTRWLT